MKTLLRRGVPFFVVLCVCALGADLALRLSLRRNRAERQTYFETVVRPAEEKAQEARRRQRAAMESGVAKQNGAIAPLPKIDVSGIDASLRMASIYDEPYYRLDRWRFTFEAIAITAGLLAVYCYTMLQAVFRKEAQA